MQSQPQLGVIGLTVHYVASVLGVGVLILPGAVHHIAGDGALVAWGLLVLLSWPFARAFAEISIRHPTASGVVDFTARVFGRVVGRALALFLLITLIIANPLLGIASGRFALEAIGVAANGAPLYLAGYGVILVAAALNLLGLRLSIMMQSVLLTALVLALFWICAAALLRAPVLHWPAVEPMDAHLIASGMLIAFFGFVGWENAAPVAPEVKHPARTYPRAITLGVITVGGLYLCMALAVSQTAHAIPTGAGGLVFFKNLIAHLYGADAARYAAFIASLLMFITMNAWTLGTSRYLHGLIHNNEFSTPRNRAGKRARLFRENAAIGLVAAGYGAVVAVLALVGGTEITLIKLTSGMFLLFSIVALAAVAVELKTT